MLWKFFERVPKTKNPNTQGGPGLSLPWWERGMLRFWLFGDFFAGRRSRERVLSMESPYRGTDSGNERTYSPWAWSVSTQIWFHFVWREPTHLHFYTQVLYKFEKLTMVHKLNVIYGWASIFSLTIDSHRKGIKLQV